ncbi:MAG TPA: hypothetical protein DHV62_04270 [Elusimicrobia bacterium]|jgi:phosphate starvation-inducible PhoH-like protein|nr:hypothetical protein [Elusimicrobiota bacterium]
MVTKKIELNNIEEAVKLFGPYDQNLHYLERNFGVEIFARSNTLTIRGEKKKVVKCLEVIQEMRIKLRGGEQLKTGEISIDTHPEENVVYVTERGKPIVPRTAQQRKYVEAIKKYDFVVAIGPAGTGKTYLAVASALAALEKNKISRIILTRPVVEAGEKLGFLPGTFYEKVDPYLKPLYDAFYIMLGPEKFQEFREEEVIEIIPLAYMRGRTLDNAFIILDEAQNTTFEQMKMFLTRLGFDSQTVITGDITQIDLEDKKYSGLVIMQEILKDVSEIKFIYFSEIDVVRHELVKRIIRAYEEWEKNHPR